jgi:drug/metabolite transporter superfamily protein YnfA
MMMFLLAAATIICGLYAIIPVVNLSNPVTIVMVGCMLLMLGAAISLFLAEVYDWIHKYLTGF